MSQQPLLAAATMIWGRYFTISRGWPGDGLRLKRQLNFAVGIAERQMNAAFGLYSACGD
ncbi:hypothetical protein [Phyllobacterium phragmitis]|uniref:hypothetical protein n=1 Tax=Phyllobacterium phragmitis TaxID=2670329 RepID=UPI001304FE43|nr:hypothetical protein [Phyllobacterium phragmitis]